MSKYRGQLHLVRSLLGNKLARLGCRTKRALVTPVGPRHCDGHLTSCFSPEALKCHHHAKCSDGSLLTAGFLMVTLAREPNLGFLLRKPSSNQGDSAMIADRATPNEPGASLVPSPLAARLHGRFFFVTQGECRKRTVICCGARL